VCSSDLIAKEAEMPVELHCHNDLGMAVACSIAGAKAVIDAGQDAYINTTVNGIGERAGNADLISVILALKYSASSIGHLDPKVNLSKAWKISNYASYAFKVPIPINQPGVGANAFAHASGIHADGALKDSKNYELYDFGELGRGDLEYVETGRTITVNEYSGVKGFTHVLGKLEVRFRNEEESRRILELVRYANVLKQKPLVEDELVFIAKHPEEVKKILTLEPLA
jgi:isopropylmalate/homocitrate/citramalate synthase